jgi:hypothetical protein
MKNRPISNKEGAQMDRRAWEFARMFNKKSCYRCWVGISGMLDLIGLTAIGRHLVVSLQTALAGLNNYRHQGLQGLLGFGINSDRAQFVVSCSP